MPELPQFALFLAAALLLALSPGPGPLYVAARTLAGGRGHGIASSLGTGLGGLVHVSAGAVGVSALVLASAEFFTLLKLAGALYLVWLGLRTIREARHDMALPLDAPAAGARRVFAEGMMVEALNPKTAAFFLAFIPQFVDPAEGVVVPFLVLGTISVGLNTAADLVVAVAAGSVRQGLAVRPRLVRRLRQTSGALLCALGALLTLARRPAA